LSCEPGNFWGMGLIGLSRPVWATHPPLVLQSVASRAQEAIGSATSVKPQAEANARMQLQGESDVAEAEIALRRC
jgi:hypothetical protein